MKKIPNLEKQMAKVDYGDLIMLEGPLVKLEGRKRRARRSETGYLLQADIDRGVVYLSKSDPFYWPMFMTQIPGRHGYPVDKAKDITCKLKDYTKCEVMRISSAKKALIQ